MNTTEQKKEMASAIRTKADELNVLLEKASKMKMWVFIEDTGGAGIPQRIFQIGEYDRPSQLKMHIHEFNSF